VECRLVGAVKIVECPRLAWQGLAKPMPAEIKADFLRTLIAAGFKQIDAVSFVGRAIVPQMADSELVLEYLDPPDDVEIVGLVWDTKGAERAIKSGSVQTLALPYSLSPKALEREINRSLEESLDTLEEVGTLAYKAGLDVVAYVSMAFGNPFGDAWDIDEAVNAVDLLAESGVRQIVLADTAGLATPKRIADVFADVSAVHDELEIGLHLRSRPEDAAAKISSAYAAGCRRFHSVLGGFGVESVSGAAGAPNLATETLLAELHALGAEMEPMRPVDELARAAAEIARKYGTRLQ
jgi:hydroxymethylglutaryl-CoA lyase